MLRQIIVGAAIGAAAYALDTLLYRVYFRRSRGGVAACAVGRESSLPEPVRRVAGGGSTAAGPAAAGSGSFPALEK